MGRSDADRNLLFGVLALQLDFITREQLIAAVSAWVLDKGRPLEEILGAQGALSAERRALLGALVAEHLRAHGDDPAKSLAALSSVDSAREALSRIGDPDVGASLGHLGADPHATRMPSVGAPTASGARFRVLRFHARGGLGQVHVARDEELGREVALKEIQDRHADDRESRARFVREAEITGGLEHPGIVPVYGLGRYEDGRPYYAMRFIRGDSLQQAIARYHSDEGRALDPGARSLEFRRLLGRLVDVCEAIAYAHSRGVLHRDLKPGNIMLGKFGETLVVDWGLAKAVDAPEAATSEEGRLVPSSDGDSDATLPGMAIGTPAFMSPEQAAGRLDRLGPASDVYSLGATLYCLLTGHAPVEGRDKDEVFRRIERGEFPRPRERDRAVPAALEAVCLKAMSRDPADRYITPLELASDIEQWLADEPVSAYREPWSKRARRWMARHRTLVTASAAALVVGLAAVGYVLYEGRLLAAQRLTAARGRVAALVTAQVRSLPLIVEQLGADRALVRDHLRTMAAPGAPDQGRLAAALVLLPDDPAQTDVLADRLLKPEATPDEVLVIRDALVANHQADRVAGRLRRPVPARAADLTDAQLRAVGALAAMAPKDPLLATHAAPIARKLVHENPLLIGSWREVFQPIATPLADPLRKVYADRTAAEPRALAYTLLFEFATRPGNPTEAEDLAALVGDADPEHFRQILLRLDSAADRDRAIGFLAPRVKEPARFDDELARRQGRWAMALLRLGRAGSVWPLFRHRDDPSLRTELIHNLARFGFGPTAVIDRLRDERDVSAQRALILCLGEFPVESIAESDRRALAERFLAWYRTDPDPGVHGGLDWLLRRWGRGPDLAKIDAALASPNVPKDRDWFVNGQGQTYALVRGPVEFRMGSTKQSDPERNPDEVQHLRRIERSFAIATREVTLSEYARFLDDVPDPAEDYRKNEQFKRAIPSPDCAIGVVTWYKAAQYCNWLSAKEGIPEDQWCYPKKIGPGMTLPADYLERTGYRLPTEGEWEYACRAGAASARLYGGSEAWLVEYGCYLTNSGRTMHPAGRLKPNDLGLFDVLGNAYEWCSDPYVGSYKPGPGDKIIDSLRDAELSDNIGRILRGGAFVVTAPILRAAFRLRLQPSDRSSDFGLRPSRTYY